MLSIEEVDTTNKAQVRRFIDIPYRLYANHPYWVPSFRNDIAMMLNREKHPYYEHSTADFFMAVRDGRDVGRIAALENRSFNKYHNVPQANFYLFDCEDDPEAATALFERVFEWARARGLNEIVGPKGFGPLDGYGIQVEGFDHRQIMNMMNYNYEYYIRLVEAMGFVKKVDFVSCFVNTSTFILPERIHRIAERVQKHGKLEVKRFKNKNELIRWSGRIGHAYNKAFINNWEYFPLTDREIKFVVDNIMIIAHHKLIKVIMHGEDIVGFLFAFHDVSAAMQRGKGRLNPITIIDLLLELRRTPWISFNGAGILPEFQGIGGNALLYSEMEKSIREFNFKYGDFTQVAESAVQMRRDLENLGGKAYKNHRVYKRQL
jgi:GNAT superfamily N-acetyltransferase